MPMDKQILYQYIDACELVRETEAELLQLRRRQGEVVMDKVKGSSYDFPFGMVSYIVRGIPDDELESKALKQKEKLLEERKAAAEAIKVQVEEWLNTVPMRMQRIIKYKVFEGDSWNEVAQRMGKKATGEGIRKEFERFMTEN